MSGNQINWDMGNEENQASVFLTVHRLLRGRYLLTAVLALIFGIAGGMFGYLSRQPMYESVGQIRIQPSLPKVLFNSEQSTAPQMFASYVSSQAALISGGRVIERALETPEWRAVASTAGDLSPTAVRELLRVRSNRSAQEIISVSFSHENPKVSATIVNAVMDEYITQFGNEGNLADPKIIRILEDKKSGLRREITANDGKINDIAAMYRTENLQPLVDNAQYTIQSLKLQDESLKEQIARYESMGDMESGSDPRTLTAEQAAGKDPKIASLLARSDELVEAKDELMIAEGLREGHRDVQRLLSMIKSNDERIAARLEKLRSGDRSTVMFDDQGRPLPSLEEIVALRAVGQEKLDAAVERASKLFDDSVAIKGWQSKREDLMNEIAQVEQRLTQIDTEKQVVEQDGISGKISIAYSPRPANSPTSDPRKKMAAVGFVGASSLPVMAMMGLAFFSHRIQYSDDGILTSTGAGIVGMLPDLGNGLTDHEIATASAFAVHQIRSQLQILNSKSETMVYGVTSPAPQDGKTSLIIAMGLSFAESGDRTLLVDLDFIGRGLSVHFGYPDAPSLAEVLESPDDIEAQVCDTEFDNLSILPAGFGDDERVSRLSPRSVGGFVEQLREEYDTILIDTGPILGSVEAAFVAPQADGVILVVGRGQLKPLVQKAIDQIVGVQGKIIATIFNRARIQELRQSSSSMSVHFSRQMSRQQDELRKPNSAWGGPLAGTLVRSKMKDSDQSPVVKSMKP